MCFKPTTSPMINKIVASLFWKYGFRHSRTSLGWTLTLRWRHNGRDRVSNHQPRRSLLNRFKAQIKENIKIPRHWPLCGEFTGGRWIPRTNGQWRGNVSIWWRHHELNTKDWSTWWYFPSVCVQSRFIKWIKATEGICANRSQFNCIGW